MSFVSELKRRKVFQVAAVLYRACRRHDLFIRKLLCGLAFIAGSTLSGAQEPRSLVEPDAQALVEILDQLSDMMIGMQLYQEADEAQVTALNLMERVHGDDTMEVLPAIYKFALWLRSAYRYDEERDQYTRAMRIIRDHENSTSLSMVTPLRETTNSYRIQKLPNRRGVSSLRRALEIAESQPDANSLVIAEILVDLGDWNAAFSEENPTGEQYLYAWNLLGALTNSDALREEWFNDPIYVLRVNPSSSGIVGPNEPGALPGHVLIRFDVTESGRTANVTVAESVPPGFKEDSTVRAIIESRFRPRIVRGELVRTRGMARNFTFHYAPGD